MSYKKYSDADLVEAYNSMMDYSNEVSAELLTEIKSRGGLDQFQQKIEKEQQLVAELARIRKEVFELTSPETDVDFVKKMIHSTLLNRTELDTHIETYFAAFEGRIRDRKIVTRTLLGSLVGILFGSIVCGGLLALFIIFFRFYLLWFFIPVYALNYFIIRILTKQSRDNVVINIATLLACVGSWFVQNFILGWLLG
jgi:hypothetical protein